MVVRRSTLRFRPALFIKRVKFANPAYQPLDTYIAKQTVKEYLESWVEENGKANLRPSTFQSYKGYILNHKCQR